MSFRNRQNLIIIFSALIFGSGLFLPKIILGQSCVDQCFERGVSQCAGVNQYRTCSNYDSDPCLEWSDSKQCSSGSVCFNGKCVKQENCLSDCLWQTPGRCLTNALKSVCLNYNQAIGQCLSWSEPMLCSGGTACGYGQCSAQQRPVWQCQDGHCVYKCLYSPNCSEIEKYSYLGCSANDVYWFSSNGQRQEKQQECRDNEKTCEAWGINYCSTTDEAVIRSRTCFKRGCQDGACYALPKEETILVKECDASQYCQNGLCLTCQCQEGPCCDGCRFRPETAVCNFEKEAEYACPWGEDCGSDVGQRQKAKFQHCSGKSSDCSGLWTNWTDWSLWIIAADCPKNQFCEPGQAACQANKNCAAVSLKPSPNSTSQKNEEKAPASQTAEKETKPAETAASAVKTVVPFSQGLAYLAKAGLKQLFTSWLFYLILTLTAGGLIVYKAIKAGDWLAQKKLEKLSSQYRQQS